MAIKIMQAAAEHKARTGNEHMGEAADDSRFAAQRDRILKAAARCFNEKGYSGTSLKDVSRHLGLTDAALYLRAADLGREALERALAEGDTGLEQARLYVEYHVDIMVGERGPVAIMSEIPSLKPAHRREVLERSRRHSLAFEEILARGVDDGSIAPCDLRMTGNAIMGAINWIPKWFHGGTAVAADIVAAFPEILTRGLAAQNLPADADRR